MKLTEKELIYISMALDSMKPCACLRVLTLLILLFLPCFAIAQQESTVIVPDITGVDPRSVPAGDGKIIIQITLAGTSDATWEKQIQQARALVDKGYQVLLKFAGPAEGFAGDESLQHLAASIPKAVLALGTGSNGCVIGDPQRPLDTDRFFNDASRFSFDVKSLAVACREGNPNAQVYLAFLDLNALKKMLVVAEPNSLFAYIDGYVTTPETAPDFQKEILQNHPAAVVFSEEPPANGGVAFLTRVFLAFHDQRTRLVVRSDADALQTYFKLLKVLPPSASPGATTRAPQFVDPKGSPIEGFVFASFSDFERRMEYLTIIPPDSQPGYLSIPSDDVDAPVLYDVIAEKEYPLKVTSPARRGQSYIGLPGLKRPMVLFYKRFSREHLETNEVTETFELPLEIILARVQAVENRQKETLQHYLADARIEYHFRLPGGLAIVDVAFDNDFFYDPSVGQEWRQKKMYVNGVPWKGKKIPQLPIPEPEKVVSLPLNLTLDKNYHYKLAGSDTINGHEAWRIEFEPAVEGRSLYKGRVWIDKKTFQRLRVSTTQTNLDPPITSNDETLDFQLVENGGQNYNVISSAQGQQIFSAGGRQVFSERIIHFRNVRINTDDFISARNSAYQSNDVMLRDTESGLRYLKKDENGNRIVEMNPSTKRKFWVFGGFYDRSTPYPLPFGGVNLLNYNWHGNGTQLNLLIAGALNVISISDPEFHHKKLDARLEAALFTVPLTDPFYVEGVADKTQDVRLFREFGNAATGLRLGEYGKITAGFQFATFFYLDTTDTSPEFKIPSNHLDIGPLLEMNYTRKGIALSSTVSAHYRSNWDAWGLPGSSGRLDPQKNYVQAQFGAGKTFYPADLHKLGLSLTYLTGKNLDRFSGYTFFYLGDVSLAGYSGSGIRFDRGALLKSFYQFNFLELIRLGGRVEYGRVRPLETSRWENHVGIGTDGTVFGPWESLISYDIGYSVFSDVPAVRHKFTVSFMLLKLF